MAGYSDFSFTALWARVGGAADAAMKASGNAPRGVVVDLPEAERTALAAQVAPFTAELEALRVQTLAEVDRRARLLVPLAGGGAFVALLLAGQGTGTVVIFSALAALSGGFLAMGNRASTYQTAVKSRFAKVTSGHLSGFEHDVDPKTDLARLREWRLFPEIRAATTTDRITGHRDGRSLSLSEMSIDYAPRANRSTTGSTSDHGISVTVVEVASGAVDDALVTLTPQDAPWRLRSLQEKISGLSLVTTGDAEFDAAYTLRLGVATDAKLLTPALRTAILGLDKSAPAGRPYLVFMPGYLAVLFPRTLVDWSFHVPPYWVPLDPDALLAQFASDLAVKNALLNAVLALPDRT
jgi:hypothetical protein